MLKCDAESFAQDISFLIGCRRTCALEVGRDSYAPQVWVNDHISIVQRVDDDGDPELWFEIRLHSKPGYVVLASGQRVLPLLAAAKVLLEAAQEHLD